MRKSNHPVKSSLCFCVFLLLLNFPSNGVSLSQTGVRYLPGFDGPLPFELETGYVSVDESDGVELFYYFIKSENNPKDDPLILWMTGGPGCSALSGLAFEIGPFSVRKVVYNGSLPTLVLNPYSWTKVSNIIFVDSPVGTGFSYSKTLRGSHSSDTKSAKHTKIFITKWLEQHPEFLGNPFYVGGDSYSGITLPIVVQEISDGIAAGHKPWINLKGYFLGNPLTDRDINENSVISFQHGMGILSYELFRSAKENCVNVNPNEIQCAKDSQAITELTSALNPVQILEPYCDSGNPDLVTKNKRRSLLEENPRDNILSSTLDDDGFECRSYSYKLLYYWANSDEVQRALNIRKGTVEEWVRCNKDKLRYRENVRSTISYHQNLNTKHYRSLIYSGDHDMVVPFTATQIWIRSLNHTIRDDWRPWYVHGQVAGYTREYTSNMIYATIKGGGHTAPEYKPKESLAMFKRWISYRSL